MKIYITYSCEEHDRILRIQTLGYLISKGKTEKLLDEYVANCNAEAGWRMFRTMEVSGEMETVLRFALGEDEYKSHADITAVYRKLRDIEVDLDSMLADLDDISECVESATKQVRELVPEGYRD